MKKSMLNYDARYPSVADLKRRARRRMPKFAFDYVDGAIDEEHCKRRNRAAWHEVLLVPRYMRDVGSVDLRARVFGEEYALPFGVAPIGLGNMMWAGAELALARAAGRAEIPYLLSTFSTTRLEAIAEAAGRVCWFQLYVPREEKVMRDLLARVKAAGVKVLVVTLDIPVGAKRNRELKNGLILPFRMSAGMVWECMRHPRWSMRTLVKGAPDFVNVARYRKGGGQDGGLAEFISGFTMPGVTRARLKLIRKLWDGALVIKGVQHAEDLRAAGEVGADGVVISNHGGRQLDAAPTSVQSLREVPEEVHRRMTVMVDCGIRTGLDVVRARALGAQMAFCGRAFFWGVGALGVRRGKGGAEQVIEIFRDEITRSLKQLGCGEIEEMDGGWLGG